MLAYMEKCEKKEAIETWCRSFKFERLALMALEDSK
jgi:hypothetical protein